MSTQKNPRRRRWLRFNLRTLMILVTIVCVTMGVLLRPCDPATASGGVSE